MPPRAAKSAIAHLRIAARRNWKQLFAGSANWKQRLAESRSLPPIDQTAKVHREKPVSSTARFVEYSNLDHHKTSLRIIEQAVSVSMGQDLGLVSISEARARACVSIYSWMFVTLPSRTVMSKTQSSLNGLFVALILPVATPTTRTRSP